MFLQDGSAQKFTFSNKQDSGSRVCMLCANIFNVREENEDDEHDHDKISAKYLTWDSCHPVTDAELLQSWERLADHARTDSKAKFKQRQQACGWTFFAMRFADVQHSEELALAQACQSVLLRLDAWHVQQRNAQFCHPLDFRGVPRSRHA